MRSRASTRKRRSSSCFQSITLRATWGEQLGLAAVEGDAVQIRPLRRVLGELLGRLLERHRRDLRLRRAVTELAGVGVLLLARLRLATALTPKSTSPSSSRSKCPSLPELREPTRGAARQVERPQVTLVAVLLHVHGAQRVHEALAVLGDAQRADVLVRREVVDAHRALLARGRPRRRKPVLDMCPPPFLLTRTDARCGRSPA